MPIKLKEVALSREEQRVFDNYNLCSFEAKRLELGMTRIKMVQVRRATLCYKCGKTFPEGTEMIHGIVTPHSFRPDSSDIRIIKSSGYMCKNCFGKHAYYVNKYDRQMREAFGLNTYYNPM